MLLLQLRCSWCSERPRVREHASCTRLILPLGIRTKSTCFFERLFVAQPTVDVFSDQARPPMLTCNEQSHQLRPVRARTPLSTSRVLMPRLKSNRWLHCCQLRLRVVMLTQRWRIWPKAAGLECQHRSSSSTRHTFAGHRIAAFSDSTVDDV